MTSTAENIQPSEAQKPAQNDFSSLIKKLETYIQDIKVDKVAAEEFNKNGHLFKKDAKRGEAVLAFMSAVHSDPKNAAYLADLAQIFRDLNQFAHAVEIDRDIIKLQPESSSAHFLLGQDLWRCEENEEAIASLKTAIKINKEEKQAYELLGNVLMHMKRFEEALEVYKAQLEFDEENPRLYEGIAIALLKLKKYDEAVEIYRTAIQRIPTVISLYYSLGYLLHKIYRNKESITVLEQATKVEPENIEVWTLLVEVLQAEEKVAKEAAERSKKAFRDALKGADDLIEAIKMDAGQIGNRIKAQIEAKKEE